MTSPRIQQTKDNWYPPGWILSDDIFLSELYSEVQPDSRVLDAGAGGGDLFENDLKTRVQEVVGVDLDERVQHNDRVHRGIVSDLCDIPVESAYFDVLFTRFVFEHVAEPQAMLLEFRRVLKPGGTLLFLTPNRYHYVSLAARLTPHTFHEWYNLKVRGRNIADTFPTLYRLNTLSTVRKEFSLAGFREKRVIRHENPPNYLLFSHWSFYIGLAYERCVNNCEILASLRNHIIGIYTRNP